MELILYKEKVGSSVYLLGVTVEEEDNDFLNLVLVLQQLPASTGSKLLKLIWELWIYSVAF